MSERLTKKFCYSLVFILAAASAQAQPAGRIFGFGERPEDNLAGWPRPAGTSPVLDRYFASLERRYDPLSAPLAESYFDQPARVTSSVAERLASLIAGVFPPDGDRSASFSAADPQQGLAGQLRAFAAQGERFHPHDLPVIWSGPNHYVFTMKPFLEKLIREGPEAATAALNSMTDAVTDRTIRGVSTLADLGAQRAVALGMPSRGMVVKSAGPLAEKIVERISNAHNSALLARLAETSRNTGMNIYYIDTDAAYRMLSPPGEAPNLSATFSPPDAPSAPPSVVSDPMYFTPPSHSTGSAWSFSDSEEDDGADGDVPQPQHQPPMAIRPLAASEGVRQLMAEIIAGQVTAGAAIARPGHLAAHAADGFSRDVLWSAFHRLPCPGLATGWPHPLCFRQRRRLA